MKYKEEAKESGEVVYLMKGEYELLSSSSYYTIHSAVASLNFRPSFLTHSPLELLRT